MIKINVLRNVRTPNGELDYDSEEIYRCKKFSLSLVRYHIPNTDKTELNGYIILDNAITGEEIGFSKNDHLHIQEEQTNIYEPKSDEIAIKINKSQAEELSKAIYQIAINNFFDFSMALKDFCEFDDLLKVNDLMIRLKSLIDEQLDKDF